MAIIFKLPRQWQRPAEPAAAAPSNVLASQLKPVFQMIFARIFGRVG